MNKGRKWLVLIFACFILSGCSSSHGNGEAEKKLDTGFIPAKVGMYDSADTAVIKDINQSKNTITFFNLVKERSYTLYFDGTTGLYDKYGSSISMEQVKEGDIVDILFLKGKKMLASLKMSESSFTLDNVSRFDINERTKEITIGDSTYRITDDLLLFSEGKRVEIMDINQVDTLQVQGIDRTIHSVSVQKGHGYLRLKNDEYFWGGWIEVGQEIIRPVEEGMLLVVPEGKYDVLLSSKGVSGVKDVTIKRNRETELDIGDLKKESVKKFGTLIIAISPDMAEVYIDGEAVDISGPIEVEYGIHQLIARAEGYQTISKYLKVGQESATIEVVMERENEAGVSSNATSDNDVTSASGGKLTIDAPKNVEVYLDGSYMGIAPVSFTKTPGIHVITLRAEGYITKSYTINIENIETNESMSFSALIKETKEEKEEADENDDSVSGNDNKNTDGNGSSDKKEEDGETSTEIRSDEDKDVSRNAVDENEENEESESQTTDS